MQWRNTSARYGLVSVLLHWSVALVVFGLFGLGFWMVGLSYYDPWRQSAPDLHKSIGILFSPSCSCAYCGVCSTRRPRRLPAMAGSRAWLPSWVMASSILAFSV